MSEFRFPLQGPGDRLRAVLRDGELGVSLADGESMRQIGSNLECFGPPVMSPKREKSFGIWLDSVLRTASTGEWRLLCKGLTVDVNLQDGSASVLARDVAAVVTRREFRHDARSLLNALGMNADLVQLLAEQQGASDQIQGAIARIRSSVNALTELVSAWAGPSSGQLGEVSALGAALQRAGHGRPESSGDGSLPVPPLWYFAALAIFDEWAAWARRSSTSGQQLFLFYEPGCVSLQSEGMETGAASKAFDLHLSPALAATPRLPFDSVTMLEGMNIGLGCWQAGDVAGICVGIPGSRSDSSSAKDEGYERENQADDE